MGRPGGDEHVPPGEAVRLAAERSGDRRHDGGHLGQAAGAGFAAGHGAAVGLHHRHAIAAQHGDIAARGGVQPHADIHRRHHQHRRIGGEQQRCRQIIGHALRSACHQVGGGGADDDQVGGARQGDMAHRRFGLEIPERGTHRRFGERRQAKRRHKTRAAIGEHRGDAAPRRGATRAPVRAIYRPRCRRRR